MNNLGSGADEVSLESESLGGSYFTYHFVEGLRGAADASQDGLVTLQEAYAYAYARTVESTTGARTGTQTPVYDVRLRGNGDLVLTEPGRSRGRLRLNIQGPGEFLVVSHNGPSTVERFVKAAGRATFAIEPGTYRLRQLDRADSREALITVPDGGEAIVGEADLSPRERPVGGRKGTAAVDWSVSAMGGAGLPSIAGLTVMGRGQVELRRGVLGDVGRLNLVLALIAGYQQGTDPAYSRFLQREIETSVGAGVQIQRAFALPRVVAKAGSVSIQQEQDGRALWGVAASAGVELGCSFLISGPFAVDVAVTPGFARVREDSGWVLRPTVSGGAGAAFIF